MTALFLTFSIVSCKIPKSEDAEAWILFRADTLRQGFNMLLSMFAVWNPWILVDDSLLDLGLVFQEWIVLAASILILVKVSTGHGIQI